MNEPAKLEPKPITRVRIGVATHVTPTGSLSGNDALQDFLLVIDECVEAGEFKVLIDFSAVQMIDSLAISALMDLQDRLMKLGGWVKVSGHNKIIAEVANITGLSDYITFLNSDGKRDRMQTEEISFGPGARLGDILVARKLIAQSKIDEALKLQDRLGKRMGQIIIDKGWVAENDVLRALGEQPAIPFVRVRPGHRNTVADDDRSFDKHDCARRKNNFRGWPDQTSRRREQTWRTCYFPNSPHRPFVFKSTEDQHRHRDDRIDYANRRSNHSARHRRTIHR